MLRRSFLATALVAPALMVAAIGCGDDGLAKRVSVSGTVKYNGEPLKKGRINFVAASGDDRGGGGDIENGEIKNISTASPGDGLFPGKYKVSIVAVEDVDLAGVRAQYKAAPDPVALSKEAKKGKSLIPTKYGNAQDSGLTADISSNNRSLTFELKD